MDFLFDIRVTQFDTVDSIGNITFISMLLLPTEYLLHISVGRNLIRNEKVTYIIRKGHITHKSIQKVLRKSWSSNINGFPT